MRSVTEKVHKMSATEKVHMSVMKSTHGACNKGSSQQ